MLHGHVFDLNTGAPMKGVRVLLEKNGIKARTDSRGYFLLYAPASAIDPTEELPKTDNLIADLPGYKSYRITNILLGQGGTHFIVDMEPGVGVTGREKIHKMMRSPEELKNSQGRPTSTEENFNTQERSISKGVVEPMSVTVPTSIRVGFNCSCATCSSVQIFSLDTYVRLGLDDEWIASWNINSLRAGAVAYRSYGVYHVYHPRNINYDICSTTCCQVLDPLDSHSSTDNATLDTTGVIVVDSTGTAPFFAEYAAENNDNFCADGFTGNPSFNWPCMSDIVDAGTTFNGHGRGMCQWGSQRWAVNQAKDWQWIVNHYYNNNGNPSGARSGLLQLPPVADFSLSSTPSSQTVLQGSSTSYTMTATPSNGFASTIGFSVSGLPGGASASFNPTSITTSGSTTMTVSTSTSTPAGSYLLTITGNSGSINRTSTATLVVQSPPDFSLSISPSSASVGKRGGNAIYWVTITRTGGDSDSVNLSVSGLPAGAVGSFSPNPTTGGTSTLTVSVSSTTARGSYLFTVTGNGSPSGLTRKATATLIKAQGAR